MSKAEVLTIGDMARRTGLTVSAIRFYEAKGLVRAVRSAGGQRRFLRADIRRLSFLIIAQRLGLSLAAIQTALAGLPQGRAPTKADWARLAKAIGAELDARIATLTRARDRLDGCIGCGCLSLKLCALHNPGDALADLGAGPRYVLG